MNVEKHKLPVRERKVSWKFRLWLQLHEGRGGGAQCSLPAD